MNLGVKWGNAFDKLSKGDSGTFYEMERDLNMKTRPGYAEWVKNVEILVPDQSYDGQEEGTSSDDSWQPNLLFDECRWFAF
jgi:hypothetical protein